MNLLEIPFIEALLSHITLYFKVKISIYENSLLTTNSAARAFFNCFTIKNCKLELKICSSLKSLFIKDDFKLYFQAKNRVIITMIDNVLYLEGYETYAEMTYSVLFLYHNWDKNNILYPLTDEEHQLLEQHCQKELIKLDDHLSQSSRKLLFNILEKSDGIEIISVSSQPKNNISTVSRKRNVIDLLTDDEDDDLQFIDLTCKNTRNSILPNETKEIESTSLLKGCQSQTVNIQNHLRPLILDGNNVAFANEDCILNFNETHSLTLHDIPYDQPFECEMIDTSNINNSIISKCDELNVIDLVMNEENNLVKNQTSYIDLSRVKKKSLSHKPFSLNNRFNSRDSPQKIIEYIKSINFEEIKESKRKSMLVLQNKEPSLQIEDNTSMESNECEMMEFDKQLNNHDQNDSNLIDENQNLQDNEEDHNHSAIATGFQKLKTQNGLRPIIIDASNIAFSHGCGNFNPLGIQIAINYFLKLGHEIVYALIPRHRQVDGGVIFEQLEKSKNLIYTPSRVVNNKRETSYDDKMILEAALGHDGVVISNDQYRDLFCIDKYKEIIINRLIPYAFVGDLFMIPDDPRGQLGPHLSTILSFKSAEPRKYYRKKIQREKGRMSVKKPKRLKHQKQIYFIKKLLSKYQSNCKKNN